MFLLKDFHPTFVPWVSAADGRTPKNKSQPCRMQRPLMFAVRSLARRGSWALMGTQGSWESNETSFRRAACREPLSPQRHPAQKYNCQGQSRLHREGYIHTASVVLRTPCCLAPSSSFHSCPVRMETVTAL